MLKVGATDLVLRMLEAGTVMRDLSLENPIRAIREMSHDMTGQRTVRLTNGRELSAINMQWEYFERVHEFAQRQGLLDDPSSIHARTVELWQRSLKAIEAGDLSVIEREIDWVIKLRLLERYMEKHELTLEHPRIAQLDLAYHDIRRDRGIFMMMESRGLVERITSDDAVAEAMVTPPATTRARLRGAFIKRATERRRDFTVDWVHLKLNDQAQRTVLCKDPFLAVDERVDRLIASM